MPRLIALVMLFCGWLGQGALAMEQAAARFDTGFDPLALYGPTATYDIFRNGEPVGSHRIHFARTGDVLSVESRSEIEVRLLFMTAYEFSYVARSNWQDGSLLRLEAMTDDNGERSIVRVAPTEDGLVAEGPSGQSTITPAHPLSEHWWQRFIAGEEQLNTITGAVNQIAVESLGTAYVPMAEGIAPAARFRIDGDIQLETWYDEADRWLGMRFQARDGSTIEYRCRTCRADLAELAGDEN
jgi:hypothetical protein